MNDSVNGKLIENILESGCWYNLKMGDSWKNEKKLHTIRYDFKPASINLSNSSIEFGPNQNAAIVEPSFEKTSENHKLFQGNVTKPFKDCLLIIDPESMQLTLEKLHSHIQVKKTRNESLKRQATAMASFSLNNVIKKQNVSKNIKSNATKEAALSDDSDNGGIKNNNQDSLKIGDVKSMGDNEVLNDLAMSDDSEDDTGSEDIMKQLFSPENSRNSRVDSKLCLSEESSEDNDDL